MNNRIIPTLALMIAIGIFFVYVNPTWSGGIAGTKAAIASSDKALEAAARYIDHQNDLIAARNEIDQENTDRLEIFLPDSVDNVGLILDLNALAARSGLSLSNIDVTTSVASEKSESSNIEGTLPTEITNPVGSVDLALSAVGTYASLQTFLKGVEKSERLLDVRDLVVKGSDTGVYTYQMKLRIYWLR